MFIFPFPRLRSAGTFLGFMMPHTVIANGLYATVFLENYSLQEEEFSRNALQTVESSGDDRNLHR